MANTKKQENKNMVDLNEIKEELTDYIDVQIRKNFNKELEKSNKRLIKEKNKKIIEKNIVIIILFCIIIFLLYLLYNNHYFDKYFNSNMEVTETNTNNKDVNETKETTKEVLDIEKLKEEYSYLIDNIIISEKSSYINDFYSGNLTAELKNYLTLNTITFDELSVEEDCNIIEESKLKEYYNKLFTDEYKSNSFEYDGIKIRYIQKLESYITESVIEKNSSNIKREIIDIEVNEDEVIITTIEGVVKDNKLYNVLSSKEINTYKNDSLVKYENKLNKVIYTFKNKKLVSIQ